MDARTLAHVGRDVHSRIRTFFDSPLGPDAPPIEVAQAVLDAIERQIVPVARRRRILPYSSLVVRVLAAGAAAPRMAAAFQGFDVRLAERLAEVRCDAPSDLTVDVVTVEDVPETWAAGQLFDVEYTAGPMTPPPVAPPPVGRAGDGPVMLHVTVLAGAVIDGPLSFPEATVSIGRSADPSDDRGRPRRNRVAFVDVADGISETVGRAHARLRRDPATGEYRLFDEGSRNGTAILRDGEVIAVHRRDPRGVRVRSGDEIRMGRAAIRVTISRLDDCTGPPERPES